MKHTIQMGLFGIFMGVAIVYAIAACFAFALLDLGMFNPVNWISGARGMSLVLVFISLFAGISAGSELDLEELRAEGDE